MKKLLLLTFFCIHALAQDPFAAPLPSFDYYSMSATPSGNIWLLNFWGIAYNKQAKDSLFKITYPDGKNTKEFRSDLFENINFFNNDIGIVSGLLENQRRHDFIYRTEDGGKTWQEVVFGKPSEISKNATVVTANGHAWMSGANGLIYYSNDFGQVWAELNGPVPENDYGLDAIHFLSDGKTGIAALSRTDGIYITTNNCATWRAIPTPLSQKKYASANPYGIMPAMYKIRIWANGTRYIINIGEKVFTSNAGIINWEEIDNVRNFEVTENGALYLIYNDGSVALKDKDGNTVWKSAEGLLSSGPICVTNNILYAKTDSELLSISPNGITRTELLSADMPIEEPYLTVTAGKELLGFDENYVVRYDKTEDKWSRFVKAPFIITNIAMQGKNVVIGNIEKEKYRRVNLETKTLEEYLLPETLITPDVKITSIKFEKGSSGCFHNEVSSVTYRPDGQGFTFTGKDSIGNLPRTLSARRVQEFTNALNNYNKYQNTVKDFDFSKKDIEHFIALVDSTQTAYSTDLDVYKFNYDNQITFYGKNPDFDFYRQKAREINTFTTADINQMLISPQEGSSTTTNWLTVAIGLSNGTFVELSNYDYEPYYLHAPWLVNINGLLMRSTSLQLAKEIDLITGGRFLERNKKDKRYALFLLIDNAYRTMINK